MLLCFITVLENENKNNDNRFYLSLDNDGGGGNGCFVALWCEVFTTKKKTYNCKFEL